MILKRECELPWKGSSENSHHAGFNGVFVDVIPCTEALTISKANTR